MPYAAMNQNPPNYTAPPPPYDEEASQPFLDSNGDDDMFKESVANSSLEIRMQFVRKVYATLTCQILTTMALSSFYMQNMAVQHWVRSNTWVMFASAIISFALTFLLYYNARKTPLNYVLLGLFTLTMSHMVGLIVTFYNTFIVIQALIITFGVFFALTLFTLQSKWDFSGMGPILFGGLAILFVAGIVQIFIPFSEGFQLALAIGGVVIFSGYIIFDTYLIFNRYSPEDYILASLSLYLDIVNLFLRVLEILSAMQRD